MDTITEQDFQEMDNVLYEYDPLPHQIEDSLDTLYGFDASMDLLGRIEGFFDLFEPLYTRIKNCTDVEILRKLSCRITLGMLIIAVIEEWHPPSRIYGSDHLDHSQMKQDIRDRCRKIRRNISVFFKAIQDRIIYCRYCRNVKVIDQRDPSNPVVIYDSENPSGRQSIFPLLQGLSADPIVPDTTQPPNTN